MPRTRLKRWSKLRKWNQPLLSQFGPHGVGIAVREGLSFLNCSGPIRVYELFVVAGKRPGIANTPEIH